MPLSIDSSLKLKLIATWFIWEGASAVVDIVLALDEKLLLEFGVCKFFVELGLLKLNPRSYGWAMFWVKWDMTWGLIWVPLIFFFAEPGMHEYKIFERTVSHITPNVAIAIYVLLIIFLCWQYAVLNSRDVRRLFDRDR